MTELELRKKYIATIEAWLGMSKAAQTHHVIIDTYNKIRPLPRGYKLSYYDAYCCAMSIDCSIKFLTFIGNLLFNGISDRFNSFVKRIDSITEAITRIICLFIPF